MDRGDVSFELITDASEGDLLTIEISVGVATITIMGELEYVDGGVVVQRAHISIVPNVRVLTKLAMRVIAEAILEETDYDHVTIRGAARTTGARPGHRPRDLRFTRASGPAEEPEFP